LQQKFDRKRGEWNLLEKKEEPMKEDKKNFKPIGAVAFFGLMVLLYILMWFSVYLINFAEGR